MSPDPRGTSLCDKVNHAIRVPVYRLINRICLTSVKSVAFRGYFAETTRGTAERISDSPRRGIDVESPTQQFATRETR
ncbi:hypothetical protein HDG33_004716 [Paraburkholderia sp. Cpub6]|nr:hypothetical protein [Paraburkholderia sp. Cpub6]